MRISQFKCSLLHSGTHSVRSRCPAPPAHPGPLCQASPFQRRRLTCFRVRAEAYRPMRYHLLSSLLFSHWHCGRNLVFVMAIEPQDSNPLSSSRLEGSCDHDGISGNKSHPTCTINTVHLHHHLLYAQAGPLLLIPDLYWQTLFTGLLSLGLSHGQTIVRTVQF